MEKYVKSKQSQVRQIEASEQHAGQRLDNFLLRELKGLPKSLVYRVIRRGEVRINKKRAKPAQRLIAGDVVRIPPIGRPAKKITQDVPEALIRHIETAIVHEDDALIVLDKPPGLAVHGGTGLQYGLIEALRIGRPYTPFLELAHRLDRETSGLILIAKSMDVLRHLHTLLRSDGMGKRYIALLHGRWQGRGRWVDLPLKRLKSQPGQIRQVAVDDEHGNEAHSYFRPIRKLANYTLVEVSINTGRTHQIRVHAAHIEHPIVGDARYGDFAADRANRTLGLSRQFLHAAQLDFQMPEIGKRYKFDAPLPRDLQIVLERLENI